MVFSHLINGKKLFLFGLNFDFYVQDLKISYNLKDIRYDFRLLGMRRRIVPSYKLWKSYQTVTLRYGDLVQVIWSERFER